MNTDFIITNYIKELIHNIEVLNVKLDVSSFIGETIKITIIDNNRRFFKRKKIKNTYSSINNVDKIVRNSIYNYVVSNYRYEILYSKQRIQIEEWNKNHEIK